MIGGLPAGTPVAFEAAYGWGWLVELPEDYVRSAPGASAAVQGDRLGLAVVGAAMLAPFSARRMVGGSRPP